MTPAARVVPDVPSFAVDQGFWYSIPEHLLDDLGVGSIVRVPLSGRRVRGWVVETGERERGRLKDVAAVSSAQRIFDPALLRGLEWAAAHYVSPLSGMIRRASPPNLPKSAESPRTPKRIDSSHPMAEIADRAGRGKKSPTTALIGNWRRLDWLGPLTGALARGSSVMVVAATVAEVEQVEEACTSLGLTVAAVANEDDAADTRSWERAQMSPCLLVGTPRIASWHVERLGIAVVLEESRRAMKDRQTPTIHVRELISTRSRIEGFNAVFFGPTPSVELLSGGVDIVRVANRAWPLVEVVDRSEDSPGTGFLSDRSLRALASMAKAGRRVFVYTHRRVGTAAMRCGNCRTLATCRSCRRWLGRVEICPNCSTAVGPCRKCGSTQFEEMGTVPERMVTEINRRAGTGIAALHPSDSAVTVGTERDLAGLALVDLAIASDVDGLLIGTGYRAGEDAIRQLARLALSVGPGKGTRLVLQTTRPDSGLVTAMRRGDPIPYLERVLVERAREGAPPSIEMIALEVRGSQPDGVDSDLAGLGVTVLGPITIDNGRRWLLTGELGRVRQDLRQIVGRWRDAGATVRVDADPIDI